jgi:hypothetical protein
MMTTSHRAAIAGLTILMVVGLAIATLPHWLTGDPGWTRDNDELAIYLPLGAKAYHDHPFRLGDPTTGGPTYFQPLEMIPGVLAARAVGAGPERLGLCWRVLAGLAVGAGWWALLRSRLGPAAAVAAGCIVMADPGVFNGQLGYTLAKRLALPQPLDLIPVVMAGLPQWRVLNPALSWPWWLVFLALTARAVARPDRGRILAAGFMCGVLFYVYFYLWTAAVAGLLLAAALDRARTRLFLAILVLGMVIGLPAVLWSADFQATYGRDWMLRSDKFLPVDRFEEVYVPRVTVILMVGLWIWVWVRAREWVWLAALATAGLLLLNQTLVTGLMIENFHWNYALGPAISTLFVFAMADLLARVPGRATWVRQGVVTGLTLGVLGSAIWFYARAARDHPETRHIQEALAAFHADTAALSLPAGAGVAGDPDFQYAAAIRFNLRPLAGYTAVLSPIPDAELDARIATNAYLLGRLRETFWAEQSEAMRGAQWGPCGRSEAARRERLAARLAAYDSVAADPAAVVDRFRIRVLALPAGAGGGHLPPGWEIGRRGSRWDVWQKRPGTG